LSSRISPKEFLELTLSSETSQRDELLRGFWELIELSGDETIQCRIELLKLLLQGVDSPTVSITHYLLGYPLQASLSKASLQDPGILNSPKTVLHSLLGILSNKEIRQENAALIQYGYELIYKICSNSETSGPALRYLRSSNDFVYRQLADLDIPAIADTLYFKTYGWLLKLVALELHITTQAKQRSNQLRLITLLFKRSGAVSETLTNSMVQEMTLLNGENVSSMLIIDIFRLIDMSQAFPDPPRTDLLDMNVVQLLASKCTKDNIVDLIRLHQLMKIELAPQVEGAGSLEELENAVAQVLRWIQKSNGENELIQSKVLFLNGWRQLIEICLSGPVELLQSDQRTQLLQEIFDVMLKEIRKPSSSTTLTSTLSTVRLSIMTNLRISIKQQEDPQKSSLNLLDGSMVETITSKILPTNSIVPSIGEGIIEWAVSSKNQKVRARLYAALLNFINLQPDFYGSREADLSTTRSLFETLNESEMNLTIGSLSAGSSTKILNKYGTSIMSVTCQDAIDGHHVTRTLAFTLLDAIMRRDGDRKWLNFMKEKGYLKHILASIELEDASLIQSLTGSSAYAFVYVHESRMAMLNTLARTRQGARALLENGLLNKLSSAKFIHSRPIIQVSSSDDDDKSRQHRYRMLIFPVLRLINTLQSSLSDRIINLQILQFVITHQDALLTPLGTTYSEPSKDLEELEEVHLITSVLCLIAAHDFSSVKGDGDVGLPDSSVRGFEIHQNKIKRILFAALPIYILSEKWIKSVSNEAYLEAQRISTNLTQTARQLMLNAIYKNETNVIFSLKLSDEAAHGAEDPPLGIMLSILKTTSQNFGLAIQDQISIKHKLENIEGLPTLELDFLSTDGQDGSTVEPTERPNLHQKQQIAKNALEKKYKVQQKLLYVQHQQLESVLFIIWRHVQYYLTTAPAKPRGILFGGDDDSTVREHSMSAADLSNFKSALRTKMNDSLLKRINDVEAQFMKIDDGDTLKQFIQPLTYRLSKTIELNQK
jgi:nuclear pore complex protein Nup205